MLEERYTVGQLEEALLKAFPAEDAENWDRTGLTVGDRQQVVTGVLFCLDPTVQAVHKAVEAGANVIVTHHPAFLDAPDAFGPLAAGIPDSGSLVWEAARNGVALMNFHTALDVSPLAAQVLPGKLGLALDGILEIVRENPSRGYGQICLPAQGDSLTLDDLEARSCAAFGRKPRVWGDSSRCLRKVVTATGSGGGLARMCLENGVDCLVCGEVKYHDALAAWQKGLCIVELGHDASELPLVDVLVQAALDAGCPAGHVTVFDQNANWR